MTNPTDATVDLLAQASAIPVADVVAEPEYADEQGSAAAEWETLPAQREFFATPYDPPVKTLIQEISERELLVRPTFQRYAVWDATRKSRFVESILLNIPIPTLFFAEDDDKSKVVVDGQQRLLALKEYCENQYALRGLEVLAPLNGKRFNQLTDRQQKEIRNRTLRCLIISARSDSEIRFQVFERLNQGGVPLNAQEVRHCVYRGTLNDLLHQLVKSPEWLSLLRATGPHQRMVDCELVLRFFALRDVMPKYSPPLKTLLNTYMRDHRHPDEAAVAALKAAFDNAVAAVRVCFGAVAFRRVYKDAKSGELRLDASVNRAVFDAQMLVMEALDPEWLEANKARILKGFIELCLTDAEFADSVSRATADKRRFEYRLRKWCDVLLGLGATFPASTRIPTA